MARSRETKIELTAYDDLFQTDESREEAKLSKIRDIPISQIDEFPDHPFKVLMDEDMEQLVDSIKRSGVMTPATVRLKEDGRYELISGHRRKKACELAGLETLKCEVKELTRDEAIIVMVESNLQRTTILPSEKAFAYKMRLEAMNRQGQRSDLTSSPMGTKLRSDAELAEKVGESRNQIQRYIRLTELVPEILQMVDDRQIAFRPAVEISYLTEEQQYTLLEAMSYNDATLDDLDPEAVAYARKMFSQKQENRKQAKEILSGLSDIDVLNKAGICFKGQITRTALLLLGKKESAFYFDGFTPRITWTLYNADKTVKAYEHFDMPFLLAVDKVYAKIRNEKYRYIAEQQTLFPEEVQQYDADLVKEIINNCIAHSDYRRHGKINVEEFEDHLVFINEGSFIPETIEKALEPGYKPPYYRNAFLCNAMVNMYMIDTNSMGIPMIYNIQKARCFPLPSYDLDVVNRVSVTVYGKVLDKNYTRLLHSNGDLDLKTVFLLDQVQKRKTISKDDYKSLRKSGLVEGRYPALFVSYKIAEAVGDKAGYVRNKGLDEKILKELIISALKNGSLKKADIYEAVKHAFSDVLTEEKQYKKLSNLLQKMKKEGIVDVHGSAVHAEWFLVE